MDYFGATVLGHTARLTSDSEHRSALLAEGEAILAAGCVSHNYFWFYREAIEATLATQQWSEVERYVTALETYAQAEPTPWSDLMVARGRALSRWGQGDRTSETVSAFNHIASQAQTTGLMLLLPAIQTGYG